MNGFMIYETVDSTERGSFDWNSVQDIIFGAFAYAYPEATDIRIYDSF